MMEEEERPEGRKVTLGGEEYRMPNHPVEEQPMRFYGLSRPGTAEEKRKRGGFFSRRGSLILFIDIVIVAILALTIYPMFGRKDRDRSMEHRFTLQAELDSAGAYFEVEVKSPRQEEKLLPGELFTLQFSLEDGQTGKQLLSSEPVAYEFPLKPDSREYHRHYFPFADTAIGERESYMARARVLSGEDEMDLRLEIKKLN